MSKTGLILLLLFLHRTECARILCLFHLPSISHQIVFQPIWKELSLRGHNVTVIATDTLNDPTLTNLTEINVGPPLYERIRNISSVVASKPNHFVLNAILFLRTDKYAESVFNNPQVSALINDPSVEFDVVLAEYSVPLGSMLAAKYKCPLVGVASTLMAGPVLRSVGIPTHPGLYSDASTPYGDAFFERVKSLLYFLLSELLHTFVVVPKLDQILQRHFGEDMPYYGDVERNASVVLLTMNPTTHGARPLGPNVIPIGQLHIQPSKPLPKGLQELLDKSDKVVYFSLGSNVKSSYLNKDTIQIIRKALSELPYTILWKYEDDSLESLPSNVVISKWFPQQDVLRHPNIKLFVTQAGYQSVEEGIVNKVPMLAIPFIFDQTDNARRIAKLGIGEILQFEDLTTESLKKSIRDMVENPRYKEAISEVADVMMDEPMGSMEKAMFWIEYVIKHKGAKYLRPPTVDVSWFRFLLIDVVAFILIGSLTFIVAFYKLLSYLSYVYSNRKHKKQIKQKRK